MYFINYYNKTKKELIKILEEKDLILDLVYDNEYLCERIEEEICYGYFLKMMKKLKELYNIEDKNIEKFNKFSDLIIADLIDIINENSIYSIMELYTDYFLEQNMFDKKRTDEFEKNVIKLFNKINEYLQKVKGESL